MKREAPLLDAVIEYLRLRNVPHARINNTGSIFQRNGKTFFGKRKHSQRGVADILACWKTWPLALELKAEGQKPSPDQKSWGASWERGGGLYFVIYDLDQVTRILEAL